MRKLQQAWDVQAAEDGMVKMDLGARTVNPLLVEGRDLCFAFKQNGNLLVHVLKDWRVNTWQEHFAGSQLESPFAGNHLGER